jgi:mxaJ protein
MIRGLLALLLVAVAAPVQARELTVCADPNNLPFSNRAEQGFENRIARLVAAELHADLRYVWWAQRRGNVRQTLNAGLCDVIPGVASSVDMLATTRPYYRSTYVAVVRTGPLEGLARFDDPRLAKLRIGVQLIGDDGSNAPPAHALTSRGIVDQVRGFPIYGDYSAAAPQAPIVDAVANGAVDVAYVWGPTAGYFAARERVPLSWTPVSPQSDGPTRPMVFDISMGVRRADVALKREIEAALARRADDIRAILVSYGVPLVD